MIGREDIYSWVLGPAGGEFKVEVFEDGIPLGGDEDFIVRPWSVEEIPFLIGRDYFFFRCGGPPDGDAGDGNFGP